MAQIFSRNPWSNKFQLGKTKSRATVSIQEICLNQPVFRMREALPRIALASSVRVPAVAWNKMFRYVAVLFEAFAI